VEPALLPPCDQEQQHENSVPITQSAGVPWRAALLILWQNCTVRPTRGLVTLCIGGGQGIALAIEALH
jgi:hypothetical protein